MVLLNLFFFVTSLTYWMDGHSDGWTILCIVLNAIAIIQWAGIKANEKKQDE